MPKDCFESKYSFKRSRVLVRVGERVVENLAQLQGTRPAGFLDSAARIRQDADVDAVFVHNIEVLAVIKSVKTDSPHFILPPPYLRAIFFCMGDDSF